MKTFNEKTLDERVNFLAELLGATLVEFNIATEEEVRKLFNDEQEKTLNFDQFLTDPSPIAKNSLGDRIYERIYEMEEEEINYRD